jgi:hypothetical protein
MFDRLVRLEYTRHHEEWISDGKPIGFFWIPADGSTFSGGLARSSLAMSWLVVAPKWVDEAPAAKRDLRRMRRLVFTSWIGCALIVILMSGFAA